MLKTWLKQGWVWLLCVTMCLWFWVKVLDRPIEHVVIVRSTPNISLAECHALIHPLLSHGWGSLSLSLVRSSLLRGNWVGRVSLERVWPYQLHIGLYERDAVAQFDQHTFVDSQGGVFHATILSSPKHRLIQLIGQEMNAVDMIGFYDFVKSECALGEGLQAMQYSPGVAWHLIFDHGLQVIVSDDGKQKQWQHFCHIYQSLSADFPLQGHVVDLRDSEGVAIQ